MKKKKINKFFCFSLFVVYNCEQGVRLLQVNQRGRRAHGWYACRCVWNAEAERHTERKMGRKVRNAQLNTESARQDDCVCEREQLPNSRKGYSITHYIVDTISLRQTDRRRQEEDCIHHHQWCCLLIGSRCWMGPNKKKTTTGHYENDSFSTGIHTHTHTRKTLPRYTHTRTRHIFFFEVCLQILVLERLRQREKRSAQDDKF